MAFPTPVERSNGVTASGTSHAIPMHATVNAGEGLLVLLRSLLDFNSTPSGWSELHEYTPGSMRTAAYYKVADGTEGGTSPAWGTATSGAVRYQVIRIAGVHASSVPESAVADLGNTEFPNPASLSPSFGDEDILWILQLGAGNSVTIDALPTNYGNAHGANTMWSCDRQVNAATEDPGTFNLNIGTAYCVVHTIAIRPAAAGGGGGQPPRTMHQVRMRRVA